MGHWEQIGVENRKWRKRQAKWPRWRRELHRRSPTVIAAAFWLTLAAIGLRAFGVL